MTERKINTAIDKINACKKSGHALEAFIRIYLLNSDLIHFVLSVCAPEQELGDKKMKLVLKVFIKELSSHPELKSVIQKSTVKSLQSWVDKTDQVFKQLRVGKHVNPKPLQNESEKIFALLKMSVFKLLSNGK